MTDEVVSEVIGTETTMANTTPVEASVAPEFASIVPAEYADKGWVKDIKDTNTLFKMTDDLKSELGKRPAGIPQEGGDWTEFNKAFGVPESAEGYELSAPQEGGEGFQQSMREAALALGLSQKQMAGMDAAVNKFGAENAPEGQDPEAQDAEFEKMTAETFGERKDEALANAKALISAHTPEQFKDSIESMSNKDLTIMASVLDGIQQKYINADDLPKAGGAVSSGMTAEAKQAQGRALMAMPAFQDKMHPEHAAVAAQVKTLYGT